MRILAALLAASFLAAVVGVAVLPPTHACAAVVVVARPAFVARPVIVAPRPVIVAPRPVIVAPRPVIVAPAPVFVPAPVVTPAPVPVAQPDAPVTPCR